MMEAHEAMKSMHIEVGFLGVRVDEYNHLLDFNELSTTSP